MDGLIARRRLDGPVAYDGQWTRSAAALLRDAATVTHRLREHHPGACVALAIGSDRYTSAVALFGVWAAGRNVLSDSTARAGGRNDAPEGDAVRLEAGVVGAGIDVSKLLDGPSEGAPPAELSLPDALLARATDLASRLRWTCEDRVLAALAPGHPAGLMLGVLVPMAAGAAFCSAVPCAESELAHVLATPGSSVLVCEAASLPGILRIPRARRAGLSRIVCLASPADAVVTTDLADSLGVDVSLLLADELSVGPLGTPPAAAAAFLAAATEPTLDFDVRPVVRGSGRASRSFSTRLPAGYRHFDGHFPSFPVLPAVVQLHELVLPCLALTRPACGTMTRLTGLKFLERIRPCATIELLLEWEPGSTEVDFVIVCDGVRSTTGRVTCTVCTDPA